MLVVFNHIRDRASSFYQMCDTETNIKYRRTWANIEAVSHILVNVLTRGAQSHLILQRIFQNHQAFTAEQVEFDTWLELTSLVKALNHEKRFYCHVVIARKPFQSIPSSLIY